MLLAMPIVAKVLMTIQIKPEMNELFGPGCSPCFSLGSSSSSSWLLTVSRSRDSLCFSSSSPPWLTGWSLDLTSRVDLSCKVAGKASWRGMAGYVSAER